MENKPIPMVDFVLHKNRFKEDSDLAVFKITNYANLLKQPPKLGMFIPCNENDSPLVEPDNYELWCKYGDFTQYGKSLSDICKPYQQAKDRVLFEGFEIKERCFSLLKFKYVENGYISLFYFNNNSNSFEPNTDYQTIEDLVKYNLTLTASAIKQLEL